MSNDTRDAVIEKAKAFWDAEYPKHNSNGWLTMAEYAAHTRGEVIDEFVRRVYEKVQRITKSADLVILDAMDAVAKEMKDGSE